MQVSFHSLRANLLLPCTTTCGAERLFLREKTRDLNWILRTPIRDSRERNRTLRNRVGEEDLLCMRAGNTVNGKPSFPIAAQLKYQFRPMIAVRIHGINQLHARS